MRLSEQTRLFIIPASVMAAGQLTGIGTGASWMGSADFHRGASYAMIVVFLTLLLLDCLNSLGDK